MNQDGRNEELLDEKRVVEKAGTIAIGIKKDFDIILCNIKGKNVLVALKTSMV